jgi:sporulation protein YabP
MEINQIIKLENRKSLLVTGVKNVKSFDSNEFILDTRLGMLEVEGKDLVLGKMDLTNEEVSIKGEINSIEFNDKENKKESLVKRFFK